MTEEKELRIPFKDLSHICIECGVCQAEIIIDVANEKHRKIDWKHAKFACPVCSNLLDSQIRNALEGFVQWYECLVDSKQSVSFRIRRPQ